MKRLDEIAAGLEDNYLFPFYWQHGDHYELIEPQIREIYDSGCRALCVESRPHPDFAGETWWRDMDKILETARSLGMKVWLLDDDHFPSGHANGIYHRKYPSLTPRYLVETHADVIGPMKGGALLIRKTSNADKLISVSAYRQPDSPDEDFGEAPISLTANVRGDFLYWDIPDGAYRVFFCFTTTSGSPDYIDFLRPESTDAFLEAVYEPHYSHYSKYFGNTFAGFFSDEPEFNNRFFDSDQPSRGFYERTVGMPGVYLPWCEEIFPALEEELGRDPIPDIPSLWYELPRSPEMRAAYMDCVTSLYSRNFSRRIGKWCADRNVMYIGHIIEDMNASSRLGCSAGHYFRSQKGQDMAGMDIVLHQIIPGFAGKRSTGSFAGGECDTDFFHYVLAKLCSSMAHITPEMQNRAMCEVFGAYGWAEGTKTMKWLADYLLVRGVNHFVPHAFSSRFPDPDCPPHFGCMGKDPQFSGFSALMSYMNKMAYLFDGSTHRATAALLYHAEGEWTSRDDYMFTEKAAVPLYDDNIDYDIIPADSLYGADIVENKLNINRESYDCLIVPHSKLLPDKLVRRLTELRDSGLCVIFAGKAPENAYHDAVSLDCKELPVYLRAHGMFDITVEGKSGMLRHYHASSGGAELFMFSNESVCETVRSRVKLPVEGYYTRVELTGGGFSSGEAVNGGLELTLEPYQSSVYVFDGGKSEYPEPFAEKSRRELTSDYSIEVSSYDSDGVYSPLDIHTLTDINSPELLPCFGGKIRYRTVFDASESDIGGKTLLDLGFVSECAEVSLNDMPLGIKICPPYRFDASQALKAGKNTLEVIVSTTLARAIKDGFSSRLLLEPSGILGPVCLVK